MASQANTYNPQEKSRLCTQEPSVPGHVYPPSNSKVPVPENRSKNLPSCRQEKEKRQKEDEKSNAKDNVDCSAYSNQSKIASSNNSSGGVNQQDEYQSNRRKSRNEEEDKRSSSAGYHQANISSCANVSGGQPYYYKTDQPFASAHPYYNPMTQYFDVFHHASPSRFNPGFAGLPFEPPPSLNFFRDCASVFPAFQSPSGSFVGDFSCQRSSNKDTVDNNSRRSAESNHSNRNSLDGSSNRGSQQQQGTPTPSLPSCKSANSSSGNYLDNQSAATAEKASSGSTSSLPKQPSNSKRPSKTPAPNHEASAFFESHCMNPFFGFGGLSPNKSHHPAHLPTSHDSFSYFLPNAPRSLTKGSVSNTPGSRTLHHRGSDESFSKNSPSLSSSLGIDFPSQDFSGNSSSRSSLSHQQGRSNGFIGNSMPAHHHPHSFGFGGFFPDAHQMTSPLSHRGTQPSSANYYHSYNQQQAMGSNSFSSRNSGSTRAPEMPFNPFFSHQQTTFDPTRAIGNPFPTHPSMNPLNFPM